MSETGKPQKTIHLALQGGGAHGAFTWGVLDALLMDGRLDFAGISGTSAGAINAVALAHGWAQAVAEQQDPAEGARAALARVWTRIMELGAASQGTAQLTRLMRGALPGALSKFSPYQVNPLDYNPLRKLIEEQIDFERLGRLKTPRVFIAATDVETGRAEIFSGRRLSAQAVMASACLPQLFQAPEIDGRLYWDGGYAANPALGPLVEMGESRDILLVQINPLRRPGKPTSAAEIADRVGDLTFNASLIAQMRSIALINELIERGVAREGLKPIRMHRIDGGTALAELPVSTKVSPQPATLEKLFALGQESAQRWLKRHFAAVGEKSSIKLQRDYGDPFKLDFVPAEPAEGDADGAAPPAWSRFLWPAEERARSAAAAEVAAGQAVQAARAVQLQDADAATSDGQDGGGSAPPPDPAMELLPPA